MNKIFTILFFATLISFKVSAQSTPVDRQQLMKLLEERRSKFDAYAASIEKHSGFFGNKTKKDMQQSNEVLTEIVQTDNRIISVLNRTVDFKNYEKVNLNYDVQSHADRVNNLLHSVDTLQKQVVALNTNKSNLDKRVQHFKFIIFLFATFAVGLFFLLIRKRKKSSGIHS